MKGRTSRTRDSFTTVSTTPWRTTSLESFAASVRLRAIAVHLLGENAYFAIFRHFLNLRFVLLGVREIPLLALLEAEADLLGRCKRRGVLTATGRCAGGHARGLGVG